MKDRSLRWQQLTTSFVPDSIDPHFMEEKIFLEKPPESAHDHPLRIHSNLYGPTITSNNHNKKIHPYPACCHGSKQKVNRLSAWSKDWERMPSTSSNLLNTALCPITKFACCICAELHMSADRGLKFIALTRMIVSYKEYWYILFHFRSLMLNCCVLSIFQCWIWFCKSLLLE